MSITTQPESERDVWIARALIAVVLFLNLQAAVLTIFRPQDYVSAFQLEGEPGRVAVVGVGILFLMWQVPYIFALLNPLKNRRSLLEAVIMQGIGLVGESVLLTTISPEYEMLRGSIRRYSQFDAGGLVLLMIALVVISAKFRMEKNAG